MFRRIISWISKSEHVTLVGVGAAMISAMASLGVTALTYQQVAIASRSARDAALHTAQVSACSSLVQSAADFADVIRDGFDTPLSVSGEDADVETMTTFIHAIQSNEVLLPDAFVAEVYDMGHEAMRLHTQLFDEQHNVIGVKRVKAAEAVSKFYAQIEHLKKSCRTLVRQL